MSDTESEISTESTTNTTDSSEDTSTDTSSEDNINECLNNKKGGRIYKIYSNEYDKIYIGSTRKKLNERLTQHKSQYKQFLKNKHNNYVSSFEILNKGGKIGLIIEFDDINNDTLKKWERFYIEQNKNICINKNMPITTDEEQKAQKKEYKEANKERHKQYMKEYNEANKGKYKEYNEANKERHKHYMKEYYEANKEKKKEYYELHKNEINKKIICDSCKCEITKQNKTQHERSNKHQQNMNKH